MESINALTGHLQGLSHSQECLASLTLEKLTSIQKYRNPQEKNVLNNILDSYKGP